MKQILIVDDSPTVRQSLRASLSAHFQVQEAADGIEALTLAKRTRFDGVVTDINMPGMNGFEFVRELKALPAYQRTPVLALTTETSPQKKQLGKSVGITAWVAKPFRSEVIVRGLQKLVG